MSIFDGLIKANARAKLYRRQATQDAAGETVNVWEPFAEVDGLCSQVQSRMETRGDEPRPVCSGTFTFDPVPEVTRAGILRLEWLANGTPDLAGGVAETVSITPHPGAEMVAPRITTRWEMVQWGGV